MKVAEDTKKMVEELMKNRSDGIRREMFSGILTATKHLLNSTHDCGHPGCRVQPENATDWEAVDNMMFKIQALATVRFDALMTATLKVTHVTYELKKAVAALERMNTSPSDVLSGEEGVQLAAALSKLSDEYNESMSGMMVEDIAYRACSRVVLSHLDIVSRMQGTRTAMADLHYQRIIGVVEAEVLEGLAKLPPEDSERETALPEALLAKLRANAQQHLH